MKGRGPYPTLMGFLYLYNLRSPTLGLLYPVRPDILVEAHPFWSITDCKPDSGLVKRKSEKKTKKEKREKIKKALAYLKTSPIVKSCNEQSTP